MSLGEIAACPEDALGQHTIATTAIKIKTDKNEIPAEVSKPFLPSC
jgi:hypothetical protein